MNEKLQVIKRKRKKIRQEVYYIKKYGLKSHIQKINAYDQFAYLLSLLGKINFVLMVNKYDDEFAKYKQDVLDVINNL